MIILNLNKTDITSIFNITELPVLLSLTQDDVTVDTNHVTLDINVFGKEPNTVEATHVLIQYKVL
jgi:hypothetical protein